MFTLSQTLEHTHSGFVSVSAGRHCDSCGTSHSVEYEACNGLRTQVNRACLAHLDELGCVRPYGHLGKHIHDSADTHVEWLEKETSEEDNLSAVWVLWYLMQPDLSDSRFYTTFHDWTSWFTTEKEAAANYLSSVQGNKLTGADTPVRVTLTYTLLPTELAQIADESKRNLAVTDWLGNRSHIKGTVVSSDVNPGI